MITPPNQEVFNYDEEPSLMLNIKKIDKASISCLFYQK